MVALLGFLIAPMSALRLAKFNVDQRQTSEFIGLPTPANALFIASLIFLDFSIPSWALVAITLFMSWLLVSEVPMFSLKFKSLAWKPNRVAYIFLLVSIALLILLGLNGLSAVIGWYIILSILTQKRA